MTYRPKGKHVNIDEMAPHALGICDKTGFVHMRSDLIRQMEWRGNALIWTGFLVGRTYADQPNPQLRPPILPPDPVPTLWPRPMVPNVINVSSGPAIPIGQLNYVINTYDGSLDGITALTETQRLQALQSEMLGVGLPGTGPAQAPYLQQGVILENLESTDWGPE